MLASLTLSFMLVQPSAPTPADVQRAVAEAHVAQRAYAEAGEAYLKLASMSADRCAAIGVRSLFGWRRNVVTGWSNKLSMWMLRFVPRRMMVWIAAKTMGRPHLPPAT